MAAGCVCIPAKIRQPQQGPEANAPHAAHEGPFLGVETVRKTPFMSGQMQGFVLTGIIGFLENRYIVSPASVQKGIFIRIQGIDFQPDDLKVVPCNLAGLPNVGDCGMAAAFACKYQDFLQAGCCNGLHFLLNLFRVKHGTPDLVLTVKPTVNTVVFAVIGNIDGCEHLDGVAKMFSCL